MDLSFLSEYSVPLIVAFCLCLGYVLKHLIPDDKLNNRYIPLIMVITGIFLNGWINMAMTPIVLVGGAMSGILSTGLYENFKQFVELTKQDKKP